MIPTRDIRFRGHLVGQTPNGPALLAAGAALAERAAEEGPVKRGARLVHFGAVIAWGVLEATSGANRFRRLLGFGLAALTAARLYDEGF